MAKFWDEEQETRAKCSCEFLSGFFGSPTGRSENKSKESVENFREARPLKFFALILIFTSSVHQEVVLVRLLRILRLRRLRLWRVATNVKVHYRHLLCRRVNQRALNQNTTKQKKKSIKIKKKKSTKSDLALNPLSNHLH